MTSIQATTILIHYLQAGKYHHVESWVTARRSGVCEDGKSKIELNTHRADRAAEHRLRIVAHRLLRDVAEIFGEIQKARIA